MADNEKKQLVFIQTDDDDFQFALANAGSKGYLEGYTFIVLPFDARRLTKEQAVTILTKIAEEGRGG